MNLIKVSSQTTQYNSRLIQLIPRLGRHSCMPRVQSSGKRQAMPFPFCYWYLLPCVSQQQVKMHAKKLCLPASAEPQLNSIQQLTAAEKAKLASVTVAAVGGVSYAGDLPDSSASEQTRREKDELMPRHELFPNAATCAEPEGHSLQLAQLQVRQREWS